MSRLTSSVKEILFLLENFISVVDVGGDDTCCLKTDFNFEKKYSFTEMS